jgi:hypothetical protein
MQASQVPDPLREKLGAEATSGLLDLFEMAKMESLEDVLRRSTERFERRLTEECSKIRLEMAEMRQEMRNGFAELRQEMATQKFDILKWVFLFWVGQALTVLGFLTMIMRALQR